MSKPTEKDLQDEIAKRTPKRLADKIISFDSQFQQDIGNTLKLFSEGFINNPDFQQNVIEKLDRVNELSTPKPELRQDLQRELLDELKQEAQSQDVSKQASQDLSFSDQIEQGAKKDRSQAIQGLESQLDAKSLEQLKGIKEKVAKSMKGKRPKSGRAAPPKKTRDAGSRSL